MNQSRVDTLMIGHDATLEVADELLQDAICNHGFKCTTSLEDIKDCNFYVAAGVSSRENVDDAIELGFSGEELEIRKNELIFYVHGQKLMELAHNIYQRCCK